MAKDYDKRLTVDITLEFPVKVDGVTYDVLTMRRPKTKDSVIASSWTGTDMEQTTRFIANLCSFKGEPVAPNVIEELDEIDSNRLAEQRAAFTGRRAA